MNYHVLCGWDGDREFPISVFVEQEGKDPVYITLADEIDKTVEDYEETLHYKAIEEAVKLWPAIEIALVDAKSIGAI